MENQKLVILFEEIENLKAQIDIFRPIDPIIEQKIMQKFRLDWNYHSNHIEGNQLTYGETKTFLMHHLTAKGKPLKDHLDMQGHNEALLFLEDIIKDERDITENFIRELHQMILKEDFDSPAETSDGKPTTIKIKVGAYKSQPNHVRTMTGETIFFATPEETPAKMCELIEWYRNKINEENPLIVAALFHHQFINIHPFADGNGRIARILMNLILMKKGFPPIIIKSERKRDYYQAIQTTNEENKQPFIEYVAEHLIYSLDLYLRGAKGENIEEFDDIDKEVELFKLSIQKEKEKIMLDKIVLNDIYHQTLKPLISKINNKLEKFDELFFEKKIRFEDKLLFEKKVKFEQVFNNYITGINKDIQSIFIYIGDYISKTENINYLAIEYNFKQFKKTENINFDLKIKLVISFNKYDYFSIVSEPLTFPKINILYDNIILEDDKTNEIVNGMAKYILTEIKNKLTNF